MLHSQPKRSPIGLDLGDSGSRSVRAVQFRFGRGNGAQAPRTARLSPWGPAVAEPTPGRISAMLDALERQGFSGRRVVLAVPQKKLLSAVLDVPPKHSGAPLDVICQNELARTHRLEPEVIESGWWELPAAPVGAGAASGAGTQVMAVGCRSSDAEAMVNVFEEAGAEVCGLECRGAAMARGAMARLPVDPQLGAVVEWEGESALVVVVRGETILYERHLPELGMQVLCDSIARKLAVDPELGGYLLESLGLAPPAGELAGEAELVAQAQRLITDALDSLALEIRASAAYASRRFGESVARVIFGGSGAEMPGAVDRLQLRSELPVEGFNGASPEASAGFLTASGLAAMPAEVLA